MVFEKNKLEISKIYQFKYKIINLKTFKEEKILCTRDMEMLENCLLQKRVDPPPLRDATCLKIH